MELPRTMVCPACGWPAAYAVVDFMEGRHNEEAQLCHQCPSPQLLLLVDYDDLPNHGPPYQPEEVRAAAVPGVAPGARR